MGRSPKQATRMALEKKLDAAIAEGDECFLAFLKKKATAVEAAPQLAPLNGIKYRRTVTLMQALSEEGLKDLAVAKSNGVNSNGVGQKA